MQEHSLEKQHTQSQYEIHIDRLQSLQDETICELSQKGDDMAMDYLIDKYKPLIRRIARSYFLVGADTEDLVQEGTIGLLKAIKHYSPFRHVKFSTFAELCIKRQVLTAIKLANRKKHSPLNGYISLDKPLFEDEGERSLLDLLSNAHNPEEIMLSQEKLAYLQAFIEQELSKLEKTVFSYYASGKSYGDIAKLIQKPEKAVDNALQRIRKKMSQAMQGL